MEDFFCVFYVVWFVDDVVVGDVYCVEVELVNCEVVVDVECVVGVFEFYG